MYCTYAFAHACTHTHVHTHKMQPRQPSVPTSLLHVTEKWNVALLPHSVLDSEKFYLIVVVPIPFLTDTLYHRTMRLVGT